MDPRGLAWIRRVEGGLVDHPDDPGGVTYTGITAPAVVGLRDVQGRLEFDIDGDGDVDGDDIRALALLPPEERDRKLSAFYSRVWTSVAYGVAWPFSLLAFDGAVHHGQRPGVALLQRALDVEPDGIIGSRTLTAARMAISTTPRLSIERYCWQRADLFRRICNRRAKSRGFLIGWLNRIAALELAAKEPA